MKVVRFVKNNKIWILLIIFLLIVLGIVYSFLNIKPIKFKLYNIKNELIENTNWEYPEQLLLEKYLNKNDNILQLGGNIGASCIIADKILNNINICVEPNPEILDTLHKNKKYTNSKFTIIEGIISENQNKKLSTTNESIDNNYWGSITTNEGNIDINSHPLKSIPNIDKINVLFADCEGCLESFIDEYEDFLKQLRLVIYEADQPNTCDYKKIENILKQNNFKNIEISGQNNIWIKNNIL